MPRGRVREREVSSGSRWSSRANSSSGSSSATRAAASSIASGSPSSRRQISSTARCRTESGTTARARSTKRIAASSVGQRLDRILLFRLDVQRLAARDEHLRVGRLRQQRRDDVRGVDDLFEVVEEPSSRLFPRARSVGCRLRATPRLRARPPRIAERLQRDQKTRRGTPTASAASCSASRVLPLPPGPVSVKRRRERSRVPASSSSRAVRRAGSTGSGGSFGRAFSTAGSRRLRAGGGWAAPRSLSPRRLRVLHYRPRRGRPSPSRSKSCWRPRWSASSRCSTTRAGSSRTR